MSLAAAPPPPGPAAARWRVLERREGKRGKAARARAGKKGAWGDRPAARRLGGRAGSVADDLGVEHALEVDEAELVLELVEEEEVGRDRAAGGLGGRGAELGHVRVVETRVDGEASGRVEGEGALDEVHGRGVGAPEDLAHRDAALAARVCAEVLTGPRQAHAGEVGRRGRPEHLEDEQQLVAVVLAREEGLAEVHLRENAADRPHVDCLGVLGQREHDLRGAVPARGHVLREIGVLLRGRAVARVCFEARKTEVADLEVALLVDQEVGRLEVAVDDAAAVEVLDALEQLVQHVGHVVVAEVVGADDGVQVRVHVLLDEVDLAEALEGRGLLDVEDLDDVRVVEALEELHLAQGAQTEEVPLERLDLLDGDHLVAVVPVPDRHHAVGALPDHTQHLVVADVEHVVLLLHRAVAAACGGRKRRLTSCPGLSLTAAPPPVYIPPPAGPQSLPDNPGQPAVSCGPPHGPSNVSEQEHETAQPCSLFFSLPRIAPRAKATHRETGRNEKRPSRHREMVLRQAGWTFWTPLPRPTASPLPCSRRRKPPPTSRR